MTENIEPGDRIEPGFEPVAAAPRRLAIKFTGSGSEYFRIWIVNLLLTLVTVGLYLPFAKARRLSYFYANTLVDGHALSFHGDPWRMFRGFLLLAVLTGTYSLAGRASPGAGLLALLALWGLWPALWRSSLRFRMGNTSWRGLRFSFRGDLAGAYLALLPIYLPALLFVLPPFLIREFGIQGTEGLQRVGQFAIAGSLAMLVFYPFSFALIKRYQHGGYAYAAQQTKLDVPTRRFYGLCVKGLLLSLLPGFAFGVMAAVLYAMLYKPGQGDAAKLITGGALILSGSFYLLLFAFLGPYFTARTQDLVWRGTSSADLRFDSALRYRSLLGLTLVNWLLTLVTLSLYRPFAAVRTARLRVEAVSVLATGDIDNWIALQGAHEQDASGDAAGDFFGIDLGL